MAFPTREELESLSIEAITHLDIRSKEDEELVQSVLDGKRQATVSTADIGLSSMERTLMTDNIKTPEQEKVLQAKLDAEVEKIRSSFETDEETTINTEEVAEEAAVAIE